MVPEHQPHSCDPGDLHQPRRGPKKEPQTLTWGFCEHLGNTLPLQLDPPHSFCHLVPTGRNPEKPLKAPLRQRRGKNEKKEFSGPMATKILPRSTKNSLLEPCFCFLRTTWSSSFGVFRFLSCVLTPMLALAPPTSFLQGVSVTRGLSPPPRPCGLLFNSEGQSVLGHHRLEEKDHCPAGFRTGNVLCGALGVCLSH